MILKVYARWKEGERKEGSGVVMLVARDLMHMSFIKNSKAILLQLLYT